MMPDQFISSAEVAEAEVERLREENLADACDECNDRLEVSDARVAELEVALRRVMKGIDRHFQERGESYHLSDVHALASVALRGDGS